MTDLLASWQDKYLIAQEKIAELKARVAGLTERITHAEHEQHQAESRESKMQRALSVEANQRRAAEARVAELERELRDADEVGIKQTRLLQQSTEALATSLTQRGIADMRVNAEMREILRIARSALEDLANGDKQSPSKLTNVNIGEDDV